MHNCIDESRSVKTAYKTKSEVKARQVVAVIVGRPSNTIPKKETPQDKEDMMAWRSSAIALAPVVF